MTHEARDRAKSELSRRLRSHAQPSGNASLRSNPLPTVTKPTTDARPRNPRAEQRIVRLAQHDGGPAPIAPPFDDEYKLLFNAAVFTIFRSGFVPRCALETDNAADNRFDKICQIIKECRYGVHDISRTESDGDPPLPRFNMPLELGLFLGAKKYGGLDHRPKSCIIFDRERYRYQRYISDIAGQDIHAHGGERRTLITELATWLRAQSRDRNVPGGVAIADEFETFIAALPEIYRASRLNPGEVTFGDYNAIVVQYLTAN